jgi:hypothetical protein
MAVQISDYKSNLCTLQVEEHLNTSEKFSAMKGYLAQIENTPKYFNTEYGGQVVLYQFSNMTHLITPNDSVISQKTSTALKKP